MASGAIVAVRAVGKVTVGRSVGVGRNGVAEGARVGTRVAVGIIVGTEVGGWEVGWGNPVGGTVGTTGIDWLQAANPRSTNKIPIQTTCFLIIRFLFGRVGVGGIPQTVT
jgi:hypothetical protein